MFSTRLIALMLCMVLLAGCFGNDGGKTDEESPNVDPTPDPGDLPDLNDTLPPPPPYPLNMTFAGCSIHQGVFPFPMDEARSMMPPGFEPERFPEDPTGQLAILVGVATSCGSGVTSNGTVSDPAELWGLVPVIPPSELRGDEMDNFLIPLGAFVNRAENVALYHAWGLPFFSEADVSFSENAYPVGRTGTVTGDDGDFAIRLDTVTDPQVEDDDGFSVRVYSIPDYAAAPTGAVDIRISAHQYTFGGATVTAPDALLDPTLLPFSLLGNEPGLGLHMFGDDLSILLEYTSFAEPDVADGALESPPVPLDQS